MFDLLPHWFQVFFFSMIPWFESRYVIPYAMLGLGWSWWHAFPFAIVGNVLPVPFILLFFHHVEKFLRRFRFWVNVMDWLFSKTRKRADRKIRRYEYFGLLLFVAVPLPFTGAWTGALVAYLFDLDFSKSLFTIFVGIVIGAVVMVGLTLTVGHIFGYKF